MATPGLSGGHPVQVEQTEALTNEADIGKEGEARDNKKAAQGGFSTGFCKSQQTLANPGETKTPDD